MLQILRGSQKLIAEQTMQLPLLALSLGMDAKPRHGRVKIE